MFSLALGIVSNAQTKYSFPSEDFITFHQTISSAERMFKNDSLLQAYGQYDMAFDKYKGTVNPSHYFKAALCALRIKEEFKALTYLEKAIKNGYEVDSMYMDRIVFYNQNTKKEYSSKIAQWQSERDASKNQTWENELYGSVESNKKYTSTNYKAAIEYCSTCMKNPKCSKTAPEYLSKYKMVKEKIKADSIQAAELLSKIQQFGFPSLKQLDKKACAIARNILLNYDSDKTNSRLDPMLFKALNDGQISPAFYAEVVDRRNLMNGMSPEFFEPLMGYEKNISKDIAAANKRRNKIGLYNIIVPSPLALKGVDPKNMKAYSKVFVTLYDY